MPGKPVIRIHPREYSKLFSDVYNSIEPYKLYCAKDEVPKWKKRLVEEKYFESTLNPGLRKLRFSFEYDESLQALIVDMIPWGKNR